MVRQFKKHYLQPFERVSALQTETLFCASVSSPDVATAEEWDLIDLTEN